MQTTSWNLRFIDSLTFIKAIVQLLVEKPDIAKHETTISKDGRNIVLRQIVDTQENEYTAKHLADVQFKNRRK